MIMFSPDSTSGPNIPVITIVCGWLFTAMAMLALLLLVWSKRIRGAAFRIDDYFTFLAFLIAIGLVIHTTSAVLDEGLGKQLGDLSKKRRAEIVKVGLSGGATEFSKLMLTLVAYGKRSLMGTGEHDDSYYRSVLPLRHVQRF